MPAIKTKKELTRKNMHPDEINRARYNPKSRQRDIGGLLQSIERVGLLYPLLVDTEGNLVDGHRRLSALLELGWTSIPVIVVEGERSELYSEVSQTVRAMTGNESLHVYLREPRACGTKTRSRINACEEVCGRATIREMAVGGFSMHTWDVARRICRYADQENPVMLKKVVKWLVKHRCGGQVKANLKTGMSITGLIRAIENDKPVSLKVTVV